MFQDFPNRGWALVLGSYRVREDGMVPGSKFWLWVTSLNLTFLIREQDCLFARNETELGHSHYF